MTQFRLAEYYNDFGTLTGTFDTLKEAKSAAQYQSERAESDCGVEYSQITEYKGDWENGEIVKDYYFSK